MFLRRTTIILRRTTIILRRTTMILRRTTTNLRRCHLCGSMCQLIATISAPCPPIVHAQAHASLVDQNYRISATGIKHLKPHSHDHRRNNSQEVQPA